MLYPSIYPFYSLFIHSFSCTTFSPYFSFFHLFGQKKVYGLSKEGVKETYLFIFSKISKKDTEKSPPMIAAQRKGFEKPQYSMVSYFSFVWMNVWEGVCVEFISSSLVQPLNFKMFIHRIEHRTDLKWIGAKWWGR